MGNVKYQTAITIGLDQLDQMDRVKAALELKLQMNKGSHIWLSKSESDYLITLVASVIDNLENCFTDLTGTPPPISSDHIPRAMITTLLNKLSESENRRKSA